MIRWLSLVIVPALALPVGNASELRLSVEEPAGVDRVQWPVTSGIPLAAGALTDDQAAALWDDAGHELPLQTESLARWPDQNDRQLHVGDALAGRVEDLAQHPQAARGGLMQPEAGQLQAHRGRRGQ